MTRGPLPEMDFLGLIWGPLGPKRDPWPSLPEMVPLSLVWPNKEPRGLTRGPLCLKWGLFSWDVLGPPWPDTGPTLPENGSLGIIRIPLGLIWGPLV